MTKSTINSMEILKNRGLILSTRSKRGREINREGRNRECGDGLFFS